MITIQSRDKEKNKTFSKMLKRALDMHYNVITDERIQHAVIDFLKGNGIGYLNLDGFFLSKNLLEFEFTTSTAPSTGKALFLIKFAGLDYVTFRAGWL